MYFTHARLVEALRTLDTARHTFSCPEPLKDANGATAWPATHRSGLPKREPTTFAALMVPYGIHGRAALEIDPDTGAVRCAICSGSATLVLEPKPCDCKRCRMMARNATAELTPRG